MSDDVKRPSIDSILTGALGYVEVGCYGGGLTRGAATPRIDGSGGRDA